MSRVITSLQLIHHALRPHKTQQHGRPQRKSSDRRIPPSHPSLSLFLLSLSLSPFSSLSIPFCPPCLPSFSLSLSLSLYHYSAFSLSLSLYHYSTSLSLSLSASLPSLLSLCLSISFSALSSPLHWNFEGIQSHLARGGGVNRDGQACGEERRGAERRGEAVP